MIKALYAIAAITVTAAGITALTQQVEAGVPTALAKSDRLDIGPIGRDCSAQAWPNFEASCLRMAGSKTKVHEARLVTFENR